MTHSLTRSLSLSLSVKKGGKLKGGREGSGGGGSGGVAVVCGSGERVRVSGRTRRRLQSVQEVCTDAREGKRGGREICRSAAPAVAGALILLLVFQIHVETVTGSDVRVSAAAGARDGMSGMRQAARGCGLT